MEWAIVEEIPRGGLLISWEFNKVQQAYSWTSETRICVCASKTSVSFWTYLSFGTRVRLFFFFITNVPLQGKKKKLHFCLKTTYSAIIFHRHAAAKNREFNYTNVVKYYWRKLFIY